MKALREKIIKECSISRTLRENALAEENFEKCQELRMCQQRHWEKFNFMKELDKALEKGEKRK